MKANKCCVPGCGGRKNLLKFPDPSAYLNQFRAWISFIGVTVSENSDDCKKIYEEYKERRMCNIHFTPFKCTTQNGRKILLYTVPAQFGPDFWQNRRIRAMVISDAAKNTIIPMKDKNSLIIQKEASKPKLNETVVIPGLSRSGTSTLPRILKKRNHCMPIVVIEQMKELEANINKPESASPEKVPETSSANIKQPDETDGDEMDIRKPRMTDTSEEDETDSDETDGNKTDGKKTRLTDTNEEEITDVDKTDIHDYEAEYLDSGAEDMETDENMETNNTTNEIEYLDVNKLDADDNQQTTTRDTRANITTVIRKRAPETIKTYGHRSKNPVTAQTMETENVSTEQSPTVKKVIKDAIKITENINIGMAVTPTQVSNPQVPNESNYQPVLEVDGNNRSISVKLARVKLQQAATESLSNPKLDDQATKQLNQPAVITQTAPEIIKALDKNTLQEFMNKHRLKPIETLSASKKILPVPFKAAPKDYNYNAQLSKQLAKEKKLRYLAKQLNRVKHKHARLKTRLQQSKDVLKHPKYIKVANKMPRIPRMLTEIQLREGLKNGTGRRFTDEERELALSLHEQCPSAYKYLKKMGFILPSKHNVIMQSNIESAINRKETMSKLKEKVEKMPSEDRLCALLFDEKFLSPQNRNKQVVTVFGTEGEENEVTFEADHALIFMVKGIFKNYQEPVSYTFSFGPTNGSDLAHQIKSVISDLQLIGYKVLATICDHADSNRMAIRILLNEGMSDVVSTENKVFKVNDVEIIPLYDPPHLLKGIRNNLISKHLMFEIDGELKMAMWKHLEMMLEENPAYNGVRLVAKFTENHVYPTKQGITRIKYASQVFSQTVGSYMGYLAGKDILPPECRDTADLLLFFDQLFDSLNGYLSNTHKNVKPLLSAVKPNSIHHKTWTEAIKVLKTMKFMNNEGIVPVADIDCWIWTLERYRLLVRKMFNEYKIPALWMRHINQDVLEGLFRREVNPTPAQRVKTEKDQNKALTPGRFAGEVVTQKVIKAINRLNREVKK